MSRVLRSAKSRLSPAVRSSTRFEFDLLGLPEELIVMVVEHVDNLKNLARLSRTCQQLQRLSEPKLYRHHTLRSSYEGGLIRHSLDKRPARESHLHSLAYLMNDEFDQSFLCLRELLQRSSHLKDFSFESPECNTAGFEEEDQWNNWADDLFRPFQDATTLQHPPMVLFDKPLQHLSKLTLHMNGIESPYWNFDSRSRSIFLLPALQYLHISCVNILNDVAEGIRGTHFSPLKHLKLEEANFTHKGLYHVLSFPKALESFELLENCHNVNHFPNKALHPKWNQLFKNNPAATLRALSQQKDSLTSLTYATSERGYEWSGISTFITPDKTPIDGGFSDFFALEKIKLVGECANFERAVFSSRPPPNLKVLVVDCQQPLERFPYRVQLLDEESPHALEYAPFFRAPASSMPKGFEKLKLVHASREEEDHEIIINVANALKKVGVVLTVALKERNTYFPPYLDGEVVPREFVYFHGEIFRGVTGNGRYDEEIE